MSAALNQAEDSVDLETRSPEAPTSSVAIETPTSSRPREGPSATEDCEGTQGPHTSVRKLLELVHELLEQHELRLCLELLRVLEQTDPFDHSLPKEHARSVEDALSTFLSDQQASPHCNGLSAIERHLNGVTGAVAIGGSVASEQLSKSAGKAPQHRGPKFRVSEKGTEVPDIPLSSLLVDKDASDSAIHELGQPGAPNFGSSKNVGELTLNQIPQASAAASPVSFQNLRDEKTRRSNYPESSILTKSRTKDLKSPSETKQSSRTSRVSFVQPAFTQDFGEKRLAKGKTFEGSMIAETQKDIGMLMTCSKSEIVNMAKAKTDGMVSRDIVADANKGTRQSTRQSVSVIPKKSINSASSTKSSWADAMTRAANSNSLETYVKDKRSSSNGAASPVSKSKSNLDVADDEAGTKSTLSMQHASTAKFIQGVSLKSVSSSIDENESYETENEVGEVDDRDDHHDHHDGYDEDDDMMASDALGRPSHPFIVHPSSNKRLSWDCASLVLIITEAFILPLSFCFDDIEIAFEWIAFVTGFFVIDLFSHFFTGYYKNGHLVMQQKAIIVHYIKSFFVLDVAASVPWDIIFTGGVSGRFARFGKMLRMIRLLRVLRLNEVVERLEDTMPSGSVAIFISIVKMILIFCMICHWCACIWGFLGSPTKYNDSVFSNDSPPIDYDGCEPGGPCEPGVMGSPWVRRYALDKSGAGTHYLVALQFSAGLLLGSNTGSIEPGFWTERVYTVLLTMVSFVFATSVLSQIVVLMDQMSSDNSELTKRVKNAKAFMQARGVPAALQAKVRRYLERDYELHSDAMDRANASFLKHLSTWLRLELTFHMNKDVIGLHPFFKEMTRPMLQRICYVVETRLAGPGDIIHCQGEHQECMSWVISGVIKIIAHQDRKQQQAGSSSLNSMTGSVGSGGSRSSESVRSIMIRQKEEQGNDENMSSLLLHHPSWLGDESIFKDVVWSTTAVSLAHSELLALERAPLLQLLQQFPKAMMHYKQFQRYIEDGHLVKAGILCGNCGLPGHQALNCSKENVEEDKNVFRKTVQIFQVKVTELANSRATSRATEITARSSSHDLFGAAHGGTKKSIAPIPDANEPRTKDIETLS